MALRSEYALGHSEFNEFLFASIGEEKSGQQLTVLSAFARQGLDPWGEAARLAGLSREAATRALAAVIGTLPEGDWKVSDARSIAGGLIDRLPERGGASAASTPRSAAAAHAAKPAVPRWVIWIAFAVAVMFVVSQFDVASGRAPDAVSASPTHSQSAPPTLPHRR